jgi:hypothetical protein
LKCLLVLGFPARPFSCGINELLSAKAEAAGQTHHFGQEIPARAVQL